MKPIVSILFALVLVPAAASADPITAYFANTGLGTSVSYSRNGQEFDVWAGQIKWTSDSWLGDFYSYCIDIKTPLESPQVFDTGLPSDISSSDGAYIAYLVSHAIVSDRWMAAGLQLAVWNVLYDTDFTVKSGSFSSSTVGAAFYANSYLLDLSRNLNQTGTALFLNSRTGQDQITPVPEPATLLLFGTGAAALAARRRRQAKVSTEATA